MADRPSQTPPPSRRLRDHRAYPIVYMFAVTFLFALVLVGVTTATRERVEANRQIRRERALLMAALPAEIDRSTPPMRVHELFGQRVRPPEKPALDPLYEVLDGEEVVAYALPLEGQGFWDRIAGFLALQPDRQTIVGIAFHDQNETPGLGAEILSPEFRRQFQDKKLTENDKAFRLIPAVEEAGRHSVHAITGATQTSNRLERIINASVADWRRQMENKRGNQP